MVDKERLVELAERCEAATGPDRELDYLIAKAIGGYRFGDALHGAMSRFTESLDAAMSLVPEGLCWRLGVNGNPKAKLLGGSAAAILGDDFGTDISKAGAATPALALCAAALRASGGQHD